MIVRTLSDPTADPLTGAELGAEPGAGSVRKNDGLKGADAADDDMTDEDAAPRSQKPKKGKRAA